ncbi:virulence factor TspB C-terminal domain-related protein [Kushneria aurantia]|uniref:Virulence factor TspB C-terminal domain-related protein n=1 Tax=Kushneria aurantia TaxID=504092 RepID=A0ABV6G4L4_9GAMM|nr:virulence factor TspB C-terminal domain-related protein [Kushneria aurantia]
MEATVDRMSGRNREIRVESNVRHSNLPGGVTRHVKTGTWIPARRFGRAASFLLKRGTQIGWAITALQGAGYLYDAATNSLSKSGGSGDRVDADRVSKENGHDSGYSFKGWDTLYAAAKTICQGGSIGSLDYNKISKNYAVACVFKYPNGDSYLTYVDTVSPSASDPTRFENSPEFQYPDSDSGGDSVSFDDDVVVQILSDNVSPNSVNDIIDSGSDISDWRSQNSDSPFSNNVSSRSSSGSVPPELFDRVGKDGQNLAHDYGNDDDSDRPYPDQDTSPGTDSSSQIYDEIMKNPTGDDSRFPDQSPEWQTEVISELPDYSTGLGSGSCPAPAVIPLPLGWGNIELDWQPICDFATYIRGAVIAVGFLAALYIVLGVRTSA